MAFFQIPEPMLLAVYEAPVVSVAVPAAAGRLPVPVQKVAYGVCKIFGSNRPGEGNNHFLNPSRPMLEVLSPILRESILVGPDALSSETQERLGLKQNEGAFNWSEKWEASFAITALRAPRHGSLSGATYYQPAPSYTGKDRVDLFVEAKDDLGQPVAMTIRYFINILPPDRLNAAIANHGNYAKALQRYCGTTNELWRISSTKTPNPAVHRTPRDKAAQRR